MTRSTGPTPDDPGHAPATEAELAEIARHLRAALPGLEQPPPPMPPRRPPPAVRQGDRLSVVRFVAGFLVPGLLILVVALVAHALG